VTDFRALLRALHDGRWTSPVGGVAATITARLDLRDDVSFAGAGQHQKLVSALAPLSLLRGAPPGLPFTWGGPVRRGSTSRNHDGRDRRPGS
jgi:hypothetical protein